jgi:hypothetical protein
MLHSRQAREHRRHPLRLLASFVAALAAGAILFASSDASAQTKPPPVVLNIKPPHISTDKSIKYDYDIVYVRAPRFVPGNNNKPRPSAWPEIAHPTNIDAGYDLMLLHPDGSEEVLVPAGEGSIADPFVSFDAQWVYYAHFYLGRAGRGSDIYKVHVPTKKVVRLTFQESTPNTGCAALTKEGSQAKVDNQIIGRGVYNLGPCPAPGGKVVFTSTRRRDCGWRWCGAGARCGVRRGRPRPRRRR